MQSDDRCPLGYVYVLIDPRDERIRYVGSSRRPWARLKEHIAERHNGESNKNDWLCELAASGLRPILRIVLCTSEQSMMPAEYDVLVYCKKRGALLFNVVGSKLSSYRSIILAQYKTNLKQLSNFI
jgi:hypothetical protein